MLEIKFDKRNYRIHDDQNKRLIKKSLDEYGAGRSIVIDNENEIIGGNGVFEAWGNKPVKIVETDGSELVVVKRTDLSPNDERRKQLAVMDNSTSDSSEFDLELLKKDFDSEELADLGIFFEDGYNEESEKDSKYTRKISVPVYEIKGEEPKFEELIDTKKADMLVEIIKSSHLSEDVKEFLIKTSSRLYEFRYDKIAEFYAHQPKETQDLMEKLALVIVDLDKAVENGYVELNNFIEEVFLSENEDV